MKSSSGKDFNKSERSSSMSDFASLKHGVRSLSKDESPARLLSKSSTREYRYKLCTFVIIALLQIFINYDNGVIPVMLNTVQDHFNFSSTELGIMGSLSYFAYVAMSPFMSPILLNFSCQRSIFVGLILNVLSLTMFGLAVNKWMFFISKFCIGATQSIFTTYYPIWIDTFAPQLHRNLWMSVLQGGIIIGMTFGYIVTSLYSYLGDRGWRYSLITQTLSQLLLTILFFIIPKEFVNFDPSRDEKINFDVCTCGNPDKPIDKISPDVSEIQDSSSIDPKTKLLPKKQDQSGKCEVLNSQSNMEDEKSKFVFDSEQDTSPGDANKTTDNAQGEQYNKISEVITNKLKRAKTLDTNFNKSGTSFTIHDKLPKIHSHFDHSLLNAAEISRCSKCFINNVKLYQESMQVKNLSPWAKFKLLLKEKVFILTCLGISSLYFEVTGIHYWMTKIGITHLGIKEKAIHLIFSIEMVTGPILGILSGSYIIDQIIYHYPDKPLYVDTVIITWGLLPCLSSVVIIFNQTPMVFAVFIFVIIFFGSAIVPAVTLMSVGYLPHRLKPAGASFFMCQYHILGFTLGTLVPGIAVDTFRNYTAGLFMIFLSGYIGLVVYFVIFYIKWTRIRNARISGGSIYIKGAVVI